MYVLAGSVGMTGAATLAARAALRGGAGMVRLGVPGVDVSALVTGEVVAGALPAAGWSEPAAEAMARAKALVIGPGLGRGESTQADVRAVLEAFARPAVVDADGLFALGKAEDAGDLIRQRPAATVLTPHEGEFERLAGQAPGDDRIAAVRAVAATTGAAVLLKGATTVVAEPGGCVLVAASGGPRLATAGTGDVLSGVIGAFLAQGAPALEAAALAAHVHGAAGQQGWSRGLVAGDLLDLIPSYLTAVDDAERAGRR